MRSFYRKASFAGNDRCHTAYERQVEITHIISLLNFEHKLIKKYTSRPHVEDSFFQSIDRCSEDELYNIVESLAVRNRENFQYKELSISELRDVYRKMLRNQLNEFRYGEAFSFQKAWR